MSGTTGYGYNWVDIADWHAQPQLQALFHSVLGCRPEVFAMLPWLLVSITGQIMNWEHWKVEYLSSLTSFTQLSTFACSLRWAYCYNAL